MPNPIPRPEENRNLTTELAGYTFQRSYQIRAAKVNEDDGTVEVAFSSEEPVQRWDYWGEPWNEVLDHTPESVDLSRLNNAGAVLPDHIWTQQLGVIESARIDGDRKGRAMLRFSKNNPRAVQELADIRDGIRQHISVGYRILELQKEPVGEGQLPTYRAIRWEPYEISIVSVPADTTVGVGRAFPTVITPKPQEERSVPNEKPIENTQANPITPPAVSTPDPAQVRQQAEADFNARDAEIFAIGTQFNLPELAREAVCNGMSVGDFRAAVLDSMGKPKIVKVPENAADLGMDDKDVRQYSMIKVIRALASRQPNSDEYKAAAYELDVSREVARKLGKEPQGFFIPHDVTRRAVDGSQRALTVGTNTAGGHTVATDLLASSFIELLRNKMALMKLGAKMLSGLSGNVAIPRQTSSTTAYWVSTENTAPTGSQPAFDQISMTPKTVGTFTDISRNLLLQSSLDVEALVRDDLSTVLALAIDLAGIAGTGADGQPKGILNTSGIGAVVGGTNGAQPTFGHIVDLETAAAVANADIGNLGYLTNAGIRGRLKQTPKVSGYPQFVWENNEMNGYPAVASNQCPNNLTKGSSSVCSPIIFGNFADMIFGEWGILDLMADPYTNSTTGAVRVVALQSVDVAIRHPASFSAMQDALK